MVSPRYHMSIIEIFCWLPAENEKNKIMTGYPYLPSLEIH
jgi:hypothetical protein